MEFTKNWLDKQLALEEQLIATANVVRTIEETGKIPPKTECPYTSRCPTFEKKHCHHTGTLHPAPFSCGFARAFVLIDRKAEERKP